MARSSRSAIAAYFLRRPLDAVAVGRAGWRLRRRHWWRSRPYLPLPDQKYWEFRMKTAFGDERGPLEPRDVVAAARWSLRQRVGK
ncbi:MAG TPA: hypothetical protein VMU98_05715 [Acidimicrobiales bacterium]|nr:hypothetical protein [Acidimicrobiales bacterium]